MSRSLYRQHSGISTREQQHNRRFREALKLFDCIKDEIGFEPFSFAEFIESVNEIAAGRQYVQSDRGRNMAFGQSHLKTLIGLSLIEYDESTKTYSINPCTTPPDERELDDEG